MIDVFSQSCLSEIWDTTDIQHWVSSLPATALPHRLDFACPCVRKQSLGFECQLQDTQWHSYQNLDCPTWGMPIEIWITNGINLWAASCPAASGQKLHYHGISVERAQAWSQLNRQNYPARSTYWADRDACLTFLPRSTTSSRHHFFCSDMPSCLMHAEPIQQTPNDSTDDTKSYPSTPHRTTPN